MSDYNGQMFAACEYFQFKNEKNEDKSASEEKAKSKSKKKVEVDRDYYFFVVSIENTFTKFQKYRQKNYAFIKKSKKEVDQLRIDMTKPLIGPQDKIKVLLSENEKPVIREYNLLELRNHQDRDLRTEGPQYLNIKLCFE